MPFRKRRTSHAVRARDFLGLMAALLTLAAPTLARNSNQQKIQRGARLVLLQRLSADSRRHLEAIAVSGIGFQAAGAAEIGVKARGRRNALSLRVQIFEAAIKRDKRNQASFRIVLHCTVTCGVIDRRAEAQTAEQVPKTMMSRMLEAPDLFICRTLERTRSNRVRCSRRPSGLARREITAQPLPRNGLVFRCEAETCQTARRGAAGPIAGRSQRASPTKSDTLQRSMTLRATRRANSFVELVTIGRSSMLRLAALSQVVRTGASRGKQQTG